MKTSYDLHAALSDLVKRSNRLGADRSVCNWGGGNTSMKTLETDFRGEKVEVLWVKGSGSDLADATDKNFTALRLNDVLPLMERESMTDEEMVEYLSYCMLNSRHPRPSIETLLHAFLPFPHVDHTHPDSIISLCCTKNGKEIAERIFGRRMVWVPYIRPGFRLSKLIAEAVAANPDCELVLMEKHGLITWGDTSEACYRNTLNVIEEARQYIEDRVNEQELFGGVKYEALPQEVRKEIAARILPVIRGMVSENKRVVLTFDDSEDFLRFTGSRDAEKLSQVGAACPDHLVHTKRVPLYVDWDPTTRDVDGLVQVLRDGLARYKKEYMAYFERNREGNEQMSDPYPRVILLPGLGVVATGKSKKMADIAAALYHRAVAVMRGAATLGEFVSLNEKESFDVEYWPLELYKLTLAPPEKELSRYVAFITGGAGGIGSATCKRLAEEGAHVVIADLALENANRLAEEINALYGEERAAAVYLDVTDENAVQRSLAETILKYGGIDILVSNAGLASSAPVTETSLAEWNKNLAVLGTGYFLTAREAFRVMEVQGIGGSIVFVTSKNAIYAGKDTSAYSSAKAMETHLARCLAVEGGSRGIRVNSVLPDAVLQGSNIWSSSWREERARAYGIHPDELEEYYRKRTILNVNVLPEDIAEAILFLASQRSAKTTGCMITVDGGVAAAFPR
ncbi:bifunctional aldolase/short-chain dehydrogenase [Polycladomyces sp. WAk]|uniref:Bifunctional aldolase/short-chain dehydrogenase n=1 Tax=Polycladomyces zharkentensis TaxID=2807616 RepID=A0ABS2WJP2_9BACL|nr:bifunctional aldolase/short-chain dehydrogenase [Polycladomyces sp. WAk]MBN2909747.1 bifunctional aldolase/short-chain dehydrogenase [Polycladomyces sp. WAk]